MIVFNDFRIKYTGASESTTQQRMLDVQQDDEEVDEQDDVRMLTLRRLLLCLLLLAVLTSLLLLQAESERPARWSGQQALPSSEPDKRQYGQFISEYTKDK